MLRVQGSQGQIVGRLATDAKGNITHEVLEYTRFNQDLSGKVSKFVWPKESEIRRQITDFSRCIRSGREPRNGINHIREFVNLRDKIFGVQPAPLQPSHHGEAQIEPVELLLAGA